MKEVIILGDGDSAYDCLFDAELWVTSAMLPKLEDLDPSSTKVFCFGSDSSKAREIALQSGINIVSTEQYATEKYPLTEIIKRFGVDYFWSSASYMIAYAIYSGYQRIHIYGIDLDNPEEFKSEKPRITFWLGVATGMGIKWDISKKSKLYRVMKENVKDRYDRAMALRDAVTSSGYLTAIEKGCDPYIFISGLDKEAVTVKNYDWNGKEVSSWHPTT